MKSFNLEEAKAGKPLVTRDGREVTIFSFDGRGDFVVIGYVNSPAIEYDMLHQWDAQGRFYGKRNTSYLDLFMKEDVIEHEGWLVIYRTEDGNFCCSSLHNDEDYAEYCKKKFDGLTVVKVKFKEKM